MPRVKDPLKVYLELHIKAAGRATQTCRFVWVRIFEKHAEGSPSPPPYIASFHFLQVYKIEQLTLRLKGGNFYMFAIFAMKQKNWHTTLDVERFVPPEEI